MRKSSIKILSVVLTLAVLACFFWAGIRFLEKDYVIWNASLFPIHEQNVDISGRRMRNPEAFLRFADLRYLDARDTGMTAAQYEWFRENIPGCTVLWDVPLQGRYYSLNTEEIHVESLTEEECRSIRYLAKLRLLDVGNWDNYDRIRALQKEYPNLTLRYRAEIAGEWWDSDVVSLILEDASAEEMLEKLGWFERLESVLLLGAIPEQTELKQLRERYPDVFFLWKMDAFGMTLETDMTHLDLTGVSPESLEELETLLPYFPELETVELRSDGMSRENLVKLAEAYPEIQFLFEIPFEDRILYTGAEEIDISNVPLENTEGLESILPCFRRLKKVVMCQCGISSEEMDALNRRYEDIRFVWSVELAGMLFRTDAVYFTPNKWGISCDDENIYDLRYCTDMVCVDIGHHIKVTNCEWVKFMPELKYLVLAETGISDLTPLTGHENLVFLEIFLSKVKDYSPLATCKSLEDLNLCYTQGKPEPIGEMTWLKRLWWSGCWAGRKYLKDKLPDTYAEYLSLSSTGRGWREGQHYYDMRDFIGMDYMVG